MPGEYVSTLTTNALLTVLANCRQGTTALEILLRSQQQQHQRQQQRNDSTIATTKIDGVSYQLAISALVRSGLLSQACTVLEDLPRRIENELDQNPPSQSPVVSIRLAESMFDLVLAAYSKQADWHGVQRVERIRNQYYGRSGGRPDDGSDDEASNSSLVEMQEKYQFRHWTGLEKVGKGKESYFLLGTHELLNITIGVHPHRNAVKNGIQLLFFQDQVDSDNQWTRRKLGYLLMQNSVDDWTSSLLGMYLVPEQRGQGIAKSCLAIWIWFCLEASIVPVTGMIQKPLLALIMQHTFGFVPRQGGVPVEVCRDPSDPTSVVLYSPSRKSLEGAFSPWDLEHQHIKIVSLAPESRGRAVRIGSKLDPPNDLPFLGDLCQQVLGKGGLTIELTEKEIQSVWFGKSFDRTSSGIVDEVTVSLS